MTANLPDPSSTHRAIRARLLAAGFDAIGFCLPTVSKAAKTGLRAFLARGYHGDMGWLAAKTERRLTPHALMPEARTIIMVAANYGPDHNPMCNLSAHKNGNISVYARHRDYHDVMKKRLKATARWMAERYGCIAKPFVDTAPVLEKPLAQQAGLGWQGKHTNLVSRQWGSWLFLGEIFTSMAIPPDQPEGDHCGSCSACLSVCPTDAFPAPYRLDARRCISYLTIEHKGVIPRDLRPAIGNRIYGCDDCLAVCPWNKFAQATTEPLFISRDALTLPSLAWLSELDDPAFRQVFAGSPIKRIGRDRFLRNVIIAMGNSQAPELTPYVKNRLTDHAPLVRGMAVWALSRLTSKEDFDHCRSRMASAEQDSSVITEWQAGADQPRPR